MNGIMNNIQKNPIIVVTIEPPKRNGQNLGLPSHKIFSFSSKILSNSLIIKIIKYSLKNYLFGLVIIFNNSPATIHRKPEDACMQGRFQEHLFLHEHNHSFCISILLFYLF